MAQLGQHSGWNQRPKGVRILCPTISMVLRSPSSTQTDSFYTAGKAVLLGLQVSQLCLQGSTGSVKDSVSSPGLISVANRLVYVISKHSLVGNQGQEGSEVESAGPRDRLWPLAHTPLITGRPRPPICEMGEEGLPHRCPRPGLGGRESFTHHSQ